MGDFFAHKVMQIPNIETVFESELIWKFSFIFLGHLEELKVFKHKVLSLSDLVSENRVRFARSIKKYFHFLLKITEKWHLLSQFQKFFFK